MTDTPSGYASDPKLAIIWGVPPAYTGAPPGSSTTTSAAPVHNPFSVALSTVRAAEQSLITSAAAIIDPYNALETQVQAEIAGGTLFGQQATYSGISWENDANINTHPSANTSHSYTTADVSIQKSAVEFAASMNPAMTRVLRMIADATESVGVFIALLDKAGQSYTTADRASVFPVPTTAPPQA